MSREVVFRTLTVWGARMLVAGLTSADLVPGAPDGELLDGAIHVDDIRLVKPNPLQ